MRKLIIFLSVTLLAIILHSCVKCDGGYEAIYRIRIVYNNNVVDTIRYHFDCPCSGGYIIYLHGKEKVNLFNHVVKRRKPTTDEPFDGNLVIVFGNDTEKVIDIIKENVKEYRIIGYR